MGPSEVSRPWTLNLVCFGECTIISSEVLGKMTKDDAPSPRSWVRLSMASNSNVDPVGVVGRPYTAAERQDLNLENVTLAHELHHVLFKPL
jgi:hypothetical protein